MRIKENPLVLIVAGGLIGAVIVVSIVAAEHATGLWCDQMIRTALRHMFF